MKGFKERLKNNNLTLLCSLLYTNIPKTFEELYDRINQIKLVIGEGKNI
jgi:hypothetical protein